MSSPPRYEPILKLAAGGMATVWVGTARGALGFRQLVAIKRPHPHLLLNPRFRSELVAEARLASMIRHANVVDVRDVAIEEESLSLVMDYIEGASLGELLVAASKRGAGADSRLPARVAVRVVRDACAGLHAAHELVDERDRPVGLVHRDVSPQNVLVGTDGIARVTDFGVAKFARKHMQSTTDGSLKGKLAYMAPEYVRGETIDRRFDVFAMGVVLWEALSGKRCFRGENEAETLRRVLDVMPDPVSTFAPELGPLDAVVACALAKEPSARFQNAAAMGAALEAAAASTGLLGGHTEVATTLTELLGAEITERRALIRTKLANEPSVASLMGPSAVRLRGPELLSVGAGPATTQDGPNARTIRTGPPSAIATSDASVGLPSMEPMNRTDAAPAVARQGGLGGTPGPTLASAPPCVGPGSPMATMPVAPPPAAPAMSTLLSEGSTAPPAMSEPRPGRAFAESSLAPEPLPKRPVLPAVLVGLAVTGAAATAIYLAAHAGRDAGAPAAVTIPSARPGAPGPEPSAGAAFPDPSPPPTHVSADAGSASPTGATDGAGVRPLGSARTTTRGSAAKPRAPGPTPSATSAPTIKRPPANPYE
jgi:serine/threonine-protein kinase